MSPTSSRAGISSVNGSGLDNMMLSYVGLIWFLHIAAGVFVPSPLDGSLTRNTLYGDPHPKQPGRRVPVPALYSQRYSEQTFIGTHNSAAVRTAENDWSISGKLERRHLGLLLGLVVGTVTAP